MKMMDVSGQDDCCIEVVTPVKKKKMKQVQLSFQTQSSIQPQNVVQSKKRKLRSPSVNCRSPKAVKISNKNLNKNVAIDKLSDGDITVVEEIEKSIEMEDVETENVKENTTFNKVESIGKNKTPKRSSTGQRKIEKKDKVKSSPLTKFLKKTDKEEESVKGNYQTSLEDEKNKSINESFDIKTGTSISQSTGNSSNEMEDIPSVAGNFLGHDSDSDVAIISLDNEDKEHAKSNKNIQEDANTGSPRISKISKLNKGKLSSSSHSLDTVMQSLDVEDKEEQTKSNENMEESIEADSPSTLRTPKIDKAKQTKITPKQQEKKLLSAKKREERERLKMEKEKRLEEERQNRQREKEEKRREKEEKEKAEKEQKMMEKKMKDLKKQMEMEQKQKEKQAKEEERRKRDEEKKKKEEEKLEAERKKQKAASNFTSFFVAKKQGKSVEEESTTEVKNFMPFEVKADMKLAPICRRTLNEEEKLSLDTKCDKGNTQMTSLYLSEIKSKTVIPRKSTRTWTYEAKDDIIILDDENDGISNIVKQKIDIEKQRTKLLQFSENRRPPYWGTWRKQSRSINSRKPFAMDMKWFNYEVDSDDEWEEEEPGESLHGSDDERDEENPDDNEYDVDNEFMVPHGYLSDEELRADEEEKVDMSPETQKFKLKVLGEQFETEMNTKTSRLKPKIIGCVWRGPGNTFLGNVPQKTRDFLSAREVWVRQIPVTLPLTVESDAGSECTSSTPQQVGSTSKKTRVPEEALPELIRLIHGNTHSRKFLVREFMSYWSKKNKDSRVSKSSLMQKIREIGQWIACPEEGPMHLKVCWYVSENERKKYFSENLPLPNRWSYTLEMKKKQVTETVEKLEKDEKKNVPLITQFTKKITQEEMKKQLAVKPTQSTSQMKFGQTKAPKRATLISVGRGEQFSKASKKSLTKNFDSSDKTVNKDSRKNKDDATEDDVVIIDNSSENEQAKDKRISEGDESGDKKESEGRIGMKWKSEREKESSMNTEQATNNEKTLKSKEHAEGTRETVVTVMDIDNDDDCIEEN